MIGPFTDTPYLVPKDLDEDIIRAGVSKLLRDSTADEKDSLTDPQPFTPGPVGTPTSGKGKFAGDCHTGQTAASASKTPHTLGSPGPYLHTVKINEGVFSTEEQLTRAFMVTNLPRDWPTSQIAEAFNVCIGLFPFPELANIIARQICLFESNQPFQCSNRWKFHNLVQ